MKFPVLVVLSNLLFVSGFAQEDPASIPSQDEFFHAISELCGKAYSGTVTVDNANSDSFSNKKLVMHVRRCDETELQIPFHVGEDASRTWLITKTGSGLSLKHDHRHSDGTEDALTRYGGHTVDAGWAQVQSFPPERFTYRLIRQGREFRVDFDLTNPVEAPPAPWGYDDTQKSGR